MTEWARFGDRALDPLDSREPGRCAVVVVSRLNPVRFDGGDTPSIAEAERRSQLFAADGVRASIGTLVTEAQQSRAFARAIASSVSATSTPRTGNPSEAR